MEIIWGLAGFLLICYTVFILAHCAFRNVIQRFSISSYPFGYQLKKECIRKKKQWENHDVFVLCKNPTLRNLELWYII